MPSFSSKWRRSGLGLRCAMARQTAAYYDCTGPLSSFVTTYRN